MKSKIRNILDPIKASEADKDRILDNILNSQSPSSKKPSKISFNKSLALAASLIIILSAFFIKSYLPKTGFSPGQEDPKLADKNDPPLDNSELDSLISPFLEEEGPKIALEDLPKISFDLQVDGMGYGGVLLYNRDELTSMNPWHEDMELDRLPVFENEFPSSYKDLEDFIPREKKDKLAKDLAGRLGVKDLDYDRRTKNYLEKDLSISIDYYLSPSIFWEEAVPLPKVSTSEEDERELAYIEYYYNLYEDLFNFKEPVYETDYSYSYEGQKGYNHYVYDGAGSDVEKILNYNFARARLGLLEENHGLFVLHLPSLYRHKKIGDYPLISKDQAIENILEGKYLTSVPFDEDISLEDIARIELEYYSHPFSKYYQPVYTAYIELEDDRLDNGLISYGIYHTPAIKEDYVDIIMDEMFFN